MSKKSIVRKFTLVLATIFFTLAATAGVASAAKDPSGGMCGACSSVESSVE